VYRAYQELTYIQSYHDVAVRLEPIILELEREQNDVLIIAHESVLRVLYGYLMACNAADIPFLSFPRNEIIEVPSFKPLSSTPANLL
jgi:broad specificity phosphatase PhoE